MPDSTHSASAEADRRRHPRRATHTDLVVMVLRTRARIRCESVDTSIGGMRVRSATPIPLGPCDIIVVPGTAHSLVLLGEVVESREELGGTSFSRIRFLPVLSPSADAGRTTDINAVALATSDPGTGTPLLRRGVALIAAGIVAAALVAAGAYVGTRPTAAGTARVAVAVDHTPTSVAPRVAPSPLSPVSPLPPLVPAMPVPVPTPPATIVSSAPATPPAAASPSPPPTSASAPAPVTRDEAADNLVHVHLGETAEDTSVSSYAGPSKGVDRVRVQLNVTPEPDGTSLPVEVTLENRGADDLHLPDGFHATITSTRDGAVVATATLTAPEITVVAPGEIVRVADAFDLGMTGEHDLTVEVAVSE